MARFTVIYLTKDGQLCSFQAIGSGKDALRYALNAQQYLEYEVGLLCRISTAERV